MSNNTKIKDKSYYSEERVKPKVLDISVRRVGGRLTLNAGIKQWYLFSLFGCVLHWNSEHILIRYLRKCKTIGDNQDGSVSTSKCQ